jgi:hypothetical protein
VVLSGAGPLSLAGTVKARPRPTERGHEREAKRHKWRINLHIEAQCIMEVEEVNPFKSAGI